MTPPPSATDRVTLRIGHSPDPDDAFMWYPLANRTSPDGTQLTPKIDTGRFDFVHVLEDIQSLNERSTKGELEITAISIAHYPQVADRYALTTCGASMGEGYGPMVVAKRELYVRDFITPLDTPEPKKRNRPTLAIPGKHTSAWLAMQLRLLDEGGKAPNDLNIDYTVVPFDQIIPKVAAGEFDAGLIIHEGQLTFEEQGLRCVEDLGKWWQATRKLPLPLGGNAIRRDLGDAEMREVCGILLRSIQYALDHREEAVSYALNYARDMGRDLADRFVGMYVNQRTLDYGDTGRRAVQQFLHEAAEAGLTPDVGEVDFVAPAE